MQSYVLIVPGTKTCWVCKTKKSELELEIMFVVWNLGGGEGAPLSSADNEHEFGVWPMGRGKDNLKFAAYAYVKYVKVKYKERKKNPSKNL